MPARRRSASYRDIDGILIFDKPIGLSSNKALQQVRQLFAARKAGHCGSLDPLATGLLPLCLGEATKFSSYLLDANKTYLATCRLGQTTTTGDAEGEVLDTRTVEVSEAVILRVLEQFRGEIEQVPPMYSALKHEGKRLYQIAREGKQVERPARRVTISGLSLLELDGDSLSLEVSCSKGTYVRTLAEDIGAELGCGAHLSALRRTAVSQFTLQQASTLETLTSVAAEGMEKLDALLMPVSGALDAFPVLKLEPFEAENICQGRRFVPAAPASPGLHRLVSAADVFLGLGEVSAEGELAAKRLMNTAR